MKCGQAQVATASGLIPKCVHGLLDRALLMICSEPHSQRQRGTREQEGENIQRLHQSEMEGKVIGVRNKR